MPVGCWISGSGICKAVLRSIWIGLHRPVDLKLPIQEVVISPFVSDWFEDLLRDIMVKFYMK